MVMYDYRNLKFIKLDRIGYTFLNMDSTNLYNVNFSVRVSNELGAAHPRTAKFSVVVVVMSAFMIGVIISSVLLIFQDQYPSLFTKSAQVKHVVYELTPLLAFCIVVNSIQPALSGIHTPI